MVSKKLWGGRFSKNTDVRLIEYSESLSTDNHIFMDDIWGSKAHAIMLAANKIISLDDLVVILTGLENIKKKYLSGEFEMKREHEDVHMNIEKYLVAEFGEACKKLHTARSRNDQVCTDTRLHSRDLIIRVEREVIAAQEVFLKLAEQHIDTVMVGYTHSQHAQPISLSFWILTYVSMFIRDLRRLKEVYQQINLNPLGSCALSGTSFPIDRILTTELLGFDGVLLHTLDAISSRDFALQMLSSLAILMTNLSKLAEEIIAFTSYEYRMIEIADDLTTGSSIMPQKKNADIAELARGKTSTVHGMLFQLLGVLKGTPTGYNRDMQELKQPIWDASEVSASSVRIMAEMMSSIAVNKDRTYELTNKNYSLATELADHLVRAYDIPFRECHRIVGGVVGQLIAQGRTFDNIAVTREILTGFGIEITENALAEVLDPKHAIERHTSLGGTSSDQVKSMIESFSEELKSYKRDLDLRQKKITQAFERTEKITHNVTNSGTLEL